MSAPMDMHTEHVVVHCLHKRHKNVMQSPISSELFNICQQYINIMMLRLDVFCRTQTAKLCVDDNVISDLP